MKLNGRAAYQKIRAQAGSSLILVTVIAATIVIIAFGASRTALVQFSQSSADEDSISAYYAAKAAIEDGLARYRYNPDTETADGKVFSFDLTSGTPNPNNEVDENSPRTTWGNDYRPADQYYDLKINFRTEQIGDFSFNNNSLTLGRDETLQLTGFNPQINPYYLRYAFQFAPGCNLNNAVIQLQFIREGSTQPYQQETVKGLWADSNRIVDTNITTQLTRPQIRSDNELASYVRIRPYYCDVKYAFQATNSSGNANGVKIDSLTSTITATGYFGNAKRTLVAKVDRRTGRLISIYDFNAYSGIGDIRP